MRRILMLSSIALVCASLAFAQGTSTQTSDQSSSVSTGTGSSTIQGCLSGSDGDYMLTEDGTGTMYKLTGKDSKLKDHVGHEVAVTGQMSTGGGSAASQQDQGTGASSTGGGSVVQVSEVKMISKHCSSGTGSSPPQ
jgi:hypothetical protein